MPIALLALAVGAFGIGTTEFVMMGLLPNVASSFGISIPSAGHLISAYALGVVIGAPLLTALSVRLTRKRMLLAMMALFVLGNLASAFAPTDGTLLAFRFLTGLPHGAFFGSGAVVAAGLVAPDRKASATSMMFMGLTVANVLGVPAGTLLGQQFGWRFTFGLVAVVGLVAMLSIQRLLPAAERPADASLRRELGSFRRGQVWLALAIVTFGLGGTFACFSYITPMMRGVAGYSPAGVTLLLSLLGVGMTIGNYLGGRLADRAPMPTLYGALLGLAAMLGLFVFTAHGQVSSAITIFLIGVTGFAIGPVLQTRIMEKASGAPSLAAAAIQSAFNVANSIGAYLGGVVIAGGLGLVAPNWVGALLAVLGLGLALLSGRLDRQLKGPPVMVSDTAIISTANPP
ncbi:MAG: MFS transporter [Sciscionella sp.]